MVREPRVCVAPVRAERDAIITAAVDLLASTVAAQGSVVHRSTDVAAALADPGADAIIVVGGTGTGRNDGTVRALAAVGKVAVRGVALTPGETATFGMIGQRPVLLVPGRLDAALAVWLTLGRHLIGILEGGGPVSGGPVGALVGTRAVLARKHASPLGLTEVVLVHLSHGHKSGDDPRRQGLAARLDASREAEPIASGYWPLQAIARANGWILVSGDSEGYPAGAEVVVRALP
jgi:molybdopterin molybdotransferase